MEMYEVSVRSAFIARHAIRLPDGSLEPSHEHNWGIQAFFRSGNLDPAMHVVIDFLDVKNALERISGELEGADLNKLPDFSHSAPTAELVARLVAQKLLPILGVGGMLYKVQIEETPGCFATYYPSGA